MKKLIVGLCCIAPLVVNATCNHRIYYEIVTGSKTGTYYQIGKDLAKYVAPNACINLKVLNSNGSIDNAQKLRSPEYRNVKFAIVQNDVLQELKKMATRNPRIQDLVDNLRVIAPLYNEEIHIIARADSNLTYFSDLRGKRISIGKRRSGTAMTSLLLYKELFGTEMEQTQAVNSDFDNALRDLQNRNIDAIIKVAGQPVNRLSKRMDAGASKYIKLLSYNMNGNSSYYKTVIKASSYPWLKNDIPTLSTKAYLITFNYKNPRERRYIKAFVRSLRQKLPMLQSKSSSANNTPHPKWKQVSDMCGASLPGGWKFYSVVNEVCGISSSRTNTNRRSNSQCSDFERRTGLCD